MTTLSEHYSLSTLSSTDHCLYPTHASKDIRENVAPQNGGANEHGYTLPAVIDAKTLVPPHNCPHLPHSTSLSDEGEDWKYDTLRSKHHRRPAVVIHVEEILENILEFCLCHLGQARHPLSLNPIQTRLKIASRCPLSHKRRTQRATTAEQRIL